MTIDITIGKLKTKSFDEVMKERISDEYNLTRDSNFKMTDFLEMEQCPAKKDGCTKKDTMYPNSAYRSGSISGISEFFREVMPSLNDDLRPCKSNDRQFTKIKPFLEEINKTVYDGKVHQHKMRLKWLKFWCNEAVELYGDEAYIMFS